MADLYNRDIKVVAGPLTISPRTTSGETQPVLAMDFNISKGDARNANKAQLKIWNLTKEQRVQLQEKGLEVIIEAGYVQEIKQIFKGDIDKSLITRDAVNWVTNLELLDGGAATKTARINESLRGGQPVGQILKKAAEAMGLDVGNLADKVSSDGGRSVLKELVSGIVLSGKADDVLDEISSSLGLKYSIQDKQLQFLAKGEATKDPPVILNAGTGLLGSPSVGEKGTITATSLLNGLIKPGRRVTLSSSVVDGTFVASKVKHRGQTWGDAWTTEVEMLPQ